MVDKNGFTFDCSELSVNSKTARSVSMSFVEWRIILTAFTVQQLLSETILIENTFGLITRVSHHITQHLPRAPTCFFVIYRVDSLINFIIIKMMGGFQ